MSTHNGAAALDRALLAAIHKHGYCILVFDCQDAAQILDHDMPALNIPDIDLLTHEVLNQIKSLAVRDHPQSLG